MSIMLFNKLLKKPLLCPSYICVILYFVFSFNGYSQNHPYPQLPKNTNSIDNLNPTFVWKGGNNFSKYKLTLYNCNYEKGDNFEQLNLNNYKFVSAVEGEKSYESSSLTVNENRPDCITTVDDGGIKIVSFKNNFTSPSEFFVFDLDGSNYEGLSYLYQDYFVMVEEYSNELLFLKLKYSSNNDLTGVQHINTHKMNNNFINGDNSGWEGITYNPIENKLYLIKESNTASIYEGICSKAPNFNTNIQLSEPFKLSNTAFKPDQISGLYHLSLNQALSATQAGKHLLVLSKATNAVYEFDLNGKLKSQLNINLRELAPYNNNFFKPEGLTYSEGKLYISSDSQVWTNAMYYTFENPEHENPEAKDRKQVYRSTDIFKTKFNLPAGILENDTEYCWQVTAYDLLGKAYVSSYFSFTTNLPCYNVLTHNRNSLINANQYYSNNYIRSYKTIENKDTLEYYASEFVDLERGFEVKKGAYFVAGIGECE